jgi:hypothetical protein
MTKRESKSYESLLVKRIQMLLSHLPGHSKEILDVESGKDQVCSVCDIPLRPCAVHPGYLCCVALKGGTELFELEAALIRLQSGEYGFCVRCGQKVGRKRLKRYPATVLCERCFDIGSNLKSRAMDARGSRANQKAKQGNSPSSQRKSTERSE